MVTKENIFLIDSTFIFENAHKTFFETPLFIVNNQDNTFIYGFSRNLLRLRYALGFNKGVLLVGSEAFTVTAEENIHNVLSFLKEFGIPFIYEPKLSILDICSYLTENLISTITKAQKLLHLAKENILFIFPNGSNEFNFISLDTVKLKIGINPEHIPTFLTLTKGSKSSTFTKRQAIRLIELYGNLDDIYRNISHIISHLIQDTLMKNKDTFMKKYSEIKISQKKSLFRYDFSNLTFDFNNEKNIQLLKSYGFYSLIRLLKPPDKVCLALNTINKETTSYSAIIERKRLNELEDRILSSKYCAIDTESSDKNPHHATLFGVSFSVKKGEAFFIPLTENDLKDITKEDIFKTLKRIFKKPIKFIGHNIKYDYLLLRRNGIKIKSIHFDTMLAAYDCYGDWDFFNLKFLSQKLLDKKIKSYKEIVDEDQTFLELPFKEIVNHACEDADVTLRLYHLLKKELENKKLDQQYWNDTLPLVEKLGDMEYEGIPINLNKLKDIRNFLLEETSTLKQLVMEKSGKIFDLDSQKEVAVILKNISPLNEIIGVRTITSSLLQHLAISFAIPKLIVKYKRLRKQLKTIDLIAKAIKNNKIQPIFNQIKSNYGQLSSVNPNIFDAEGVSELRYCFKNDFQDFFKDSKKSLDILENFSKDVILCKDRLTENKQNQFMNSHSLMKGLDQDALLLSVIIGLSDSKLSKRFLIDQLTVSTIRYELEVRYSILFQWLENYKKQTLSHGFASFGNERKYFDGLKSSSIEKREKALNLAVTWLIH